MFCGWGKRLREEKHGHFIESDGAEEIVARVKLGREKKKTLSMRRKRESAHSTAPTTEPRSPQRHLGGNTKGSHTKQPVDRQGFLQLTKGDY